MATEKEVVRIKRYPNRRFYDCNASKYISLDDIEQQVQGGRKVEIRESQSGVEITRSVLTRIILERQPDKMLLFPTEMLHFILRANDVSAGFLRDYFQHSLTYLDYLSRHSPGGSALARPMHWAKAWLESIAPSPPGGRPTSVPAKGDREPAMTAVDEKDYDVEDYDVEDYDVEDYDEEDQEAIRLARRVEQLEERIRQLESQGQP